MGTLGQAGCLATNGTPLRPAKSLHNTRLHLQGAPQRLAPDEKRRPHLRALSGASRCYAAGDECNLPLASSFHFSVGAPSFCKYSSSPCTSAADLETKSRRSFTNTRMNRMSCSVIGVPAGR